MALLFSWLVHLNNDIYIQMFLFGTAYKVLWRTLQIKVARDKEYSFV